MFRRSIEMKLVKNPKPKKTDEDPEPTVPVDYAQIVRETTETVVKGVIITVGSFVVLDTLRQAIVKITPQH